jgi:hypothetical protein
MMQEVLYEKKVMSLLEQILQFLDLNLIEIKSMQKQKWIFQVEKNQKSMFLQRKR